MAEGIAKFFESAELKNAQLAMRAIAHPLRLRMVEFIHQNSSVHVNRIYGELKLEQSIASQHLRILRDANLVTTKRNGKFRYYSLNYPKIENITTAIKRFFTAN